MSPIGQPSCSTSCSSCKPSISNQQTNNHCFSLSLSLSVSFFMCILHIRKPVTWPGSNSIGSSCTVPIFENMFDEYHVLLYFYKAPTTPVISFESSIHTCDFSLVYQ